MKRTITLMLAACCLLLTACDNSSNGIIGGSDEPAQVYTNKSNENKDYEQYLTELCPPSKNGHKKASKNEMNRSISLIY